MILWIPFFFLLVDSWVLSAGGAGTVVLACSLGWNPSSPVAAGCVVSVAAGVASDAGALAAGAGRESALPGVTVSTVAVFLRWSLPRRQSAAAQRKGSRRPIRWPASSLARPYEMQWKHPAWSQKAHGALPDLGGLPTVPFASAQRAAGSAGGTGTPNLVSLFFASPARGESG